MRECPNCHKVNLATRKFCIRCGSSLLKPVKISPAKTEPTPEPTKTEPQKIEPPSPTTEDRWVRPSQVSKERIRHFEHSSRESEFEKAKKAFARAEEVGIDEVGDGIIETRMLRASEVKELLEGPGAMVGEEPMVAHEETTEAPSDTEAPIRAPTSEDMEQQILGQWSSLVDRESETQPESAVTETPESPIRMSTVDSTGFSSSRYSDSSVEPKVEEPVISSEVEVPIVPEPPEELVPKDEQHEIGLSAEHVITCPQCKNIITLDGYEYPQEIYSAMAEARLKQAKYLIVQGREHDARKIVKIARILFEKADDGGGLAQLEQLMETLSIDS